MIRSKGLYGAMSSRVSRGWSSRMLSGAKPAPSFREIVDRQAGTADHGLSAHDVRVDFIRSYVAIAYA